MPAKYILNLFHGLLIRRGLLPEGNPGPSPAICIHPWYGKADIHCLNVGKVFQKFRQPFNILFPVSQAGNNNISNP